MKMPDGNTTAELMHARAEGEEHAPEFTAGEIVSDEELFGDLLHDCESVAWLSPLAKCFGGRLSEAIQALGVLEDLTRITGNVAHVNAVLDLREMLHKLSDLEKEAINQAEACNGE
jgi:hypothetical protein